MAIQLRDGIDIPNSIMQLRQCVVDLRNFVGSSGGSDTAPHRDRYLSAVERVEPQLGSIFADPAVWKHLYGDRYWIIRAAGGDTPRPMPLINGEAEDQARYIDLLIDQLKRLEERLAAAPGVIAVLDTHVLLHFMPPQQVDWRKILGTETVRLVLPLRVVEELDMSKYRERGDLADRARRLLGQLWTLLAPTAGGPAEISDGVTIEVPIDDDPKKRTLDADQEILHECLALKAVGQAVTLVSDDTGLSIRATARGVKVIPMPERYLRRRPNVSDDIDANSRFDGPELVDHNE